MSPKAYWEGNAPIGGIPEFDEEAFFEKYKELLQEPMYSLKSSRAIVQGLTYKKVNDWDNANILQFSRAKKEGWRKFSFIDIIRIQIISDLRQFGFELNKIQHLFMSLSARNFDDENSIEKATCNCLDGSKIILLVDDRERLKFMNETDVMRILLPLHVFSRPFLLLPFFNYVRKIAVKDLPINPETSLSKVILKDKEKYILELIKKQEYENISITKNNGKQYTIKATTKKHGTISDKEIAEAISGSDYQNVKISRVKGKTISIIREETIKI